MIKLLKEFNEFLKEYKVTGLAVALVIGLASTSFVKAIVDDLVMPLVSPLIPGGNWQSATLTLGPFVIAWGPLLSAFINFVIIAFVVFLIAKFVLREEKVTKK